MVVELSARNVRVGGGNGTVERVRCLRKDCSVGGNI